MKPHRKLPACLYFVPFCLTVSFLFCFSGSSAEPRKWRTPVRTDTVPAGVDSTRYIYEAEDVDIEVSFKGGLRAWWKFLERNLNGNKPAEAGAPAGQYFVVVQFIVNRDGKISDLKSLTNHGYGMEEEVIRVMKKSPDWEPALRNGREVNAYRKQPVTFIISAKDSL